jgi:DnaK suppressor protein
MDKSKLRAYQSALMQMKEQILSGPIYNSREDLHISSDDLSDEADLATSVVNQQVTLNIRQRELQKLRLIEASLARIEDGSFGHCEDCGETIGDSRLKNQPWTMLCITHAEEKEREEQRFTRIA